MPILQLSNSVTMAELNKNHQLTNSNSHHTVSLPTHNHHISNQRTITKIKGKINMVAQAILAMKLSATEWDLETTQALRPRKPQSKCIIHQEVNLISLCSETLTSWRGSLGEWHQTDNRMTVKNLYLQIPLREHKWARQKTTIVNVYTSHCKLSQIQLNVSVLSMN